MASIKHSQEAVAASVAHPPLAELRERQDATESACQRNTSMLVSMHSWAGQTAHKLRQLQESDAALQRQVGHLAALHAAKDVAIGELKAVVEDLQEQITDLKQAAKRKARDLQTGGKRAKAHLACSSDSAVNNGGAALENARNNAIAPVETLDVKVECRRTCAPAEA
jgi:chromosome segregation ATPase